MLVWNVLHVARWKYRTQKITKNAPSGHRGTTLSSCIFITKAYIDNWKKNLLNSNISCTCPHNMANPTSCWDRFRSLGHPSKFQRLSRLAFVTAATSLTGGQPNFARCLAVSWVSTLYIHFCRLLPPDRILPGGKIDFTSKSCILLYWHCYCMALGQWASAKLCGMYKEGITEVSQRAPPIFGWVAITLGICPHSSLNAVLQLSELLVINSQTF